MKLSLRWQQQLSCNDGAAAMLLASETAVKKYGLQPIAKIVSMAVAGVEPAVMGIGAVPATKNIYSFVKPNR